METSTVRSIERTTSQPPVVREAWKQELAEAIRDPVELCELLKLDLNPLKLHPAVDHHADNASQNFPLLVPRGFVSRMKQGDPNDPLLLQVLPRPEELHDAPGFV